MAFKVDQIKNEILRYVSTKPQVLQAALLSDQVLLHKHAKTVRKLKGEFPALSVLVSHVVQTFYSKKFTPFGDISFVKKDLRAFRQKVDFQFDPADVLGTVLESEYNETEKRENMSISKMAIDWLKAKIIDDVNWLSVNGVYDPASIGADSPVFGTSMNGLNTVVDKMILDTVNPVFTIPGNAITSNNALSEITTFERSLPEGIKVDKLFVPQTVAEDYQIEYEDKFGQNKFQDAPLKSRLKKLDIVPIPGFKHVIATTKDNLLEMIDDRENPAEISDVQVDKRIVNILGEFVLGYDFALNQGVFVHSADGTKNLGLNNTEQNKLFYPQTFN